MPHPMNASPEDAAPLSLESVPPLPANDEAEQALLGAILAENRAYDAVAEFLRPEHFADGIHADIFAAAAQLINEGRAANAITLRHHFERREELTDVGGGEYLNRLQAAFVTVINARDYGLTILDCWQRRLMIELSQEVIQRSRDAGLERTSDDIAGMAIAELTDMLEAGRREGGLTSAAEGMLEVAQRTEAIARGETEPTLSTGLVDLDKLIGGLNRQDLIILGGRPSMGKTALATKIAYNVAAASENSEGLDGTPATSPQPVAFFSLEMSAEQLNRRVAAERAGVSFRDSQEYGGLSSDEQQRFIDACMACRRLPLFVDGTPNLAPAQILARARAMKRRHGLSLVIVDHLGHVKPPQRTERRHLDLGGITKSLKALAKQLNVPVVLLCQLGRGVEQRDDKRPTLPDLRESGHIEEDADVVLFVYRGHYYKKRESPEQKDTEDQEAYAKRLGRWEKACSRLAGLGEVICAKSRNGATGTVRLAYVDRLMRWEDRARDLYGDER